MYASLKTMAIVAALLPSAMGVQMFIDGSRDGACIFNNQRCSWAVPQQCEGYTHAFEEGAKFQPGRVSSQECEKADLKTSEMAQCCSILQTKPKCGDQQPTLYCFDKENGPYKTPSSMCGAMIGKLESTLAQMKSNCSEGDDLDL